MKSFEYEEIELNMDSWKSRFKESFKMFYQRPILSFLPFFIISYVMFVELMYFNTQFTINIALFLSVFVIPLLSFELCTSNDNSKVPFKDSGYLISNPIKTVYTVVAIILAVVVTVIFALSMLENLMEFIFPILKSNPVEEISKFPIIEKSYPETALLIVNLLYKMLGAIFTTVFMSISYILVFFIYLILHVVKMHDLSDNSKLIEMAMEGFDKNAKLIMFIGVFSLVQSCTVFFIADYRIVTVILWAVFSSFGVILCYLLSKEISGGGSKLEEKKSLLSGLFQKQQQLVNLES